MIKASYLTSILLTCLALFLAIENRSNLSALSSRLGSEASLSQGVAFSIRISKMGFAKLDRMAALSTAHGFLKQESRKWVKCQIINAGNSTPCKIRLRGDLPKHWKGMKRSYRLKFKDQSPFWGWKKVDLIIPEDKGFESEIVAYRLAKKLGLISPGAAFTSVSINGVNAGTYLVKQGDSGSLFELNGRTESLLIKETNIWWYAQNAGGIYKGLYYGREGDLSNLRSLPILYSPVFAGKASSDLTYSRFAEFLELLASGGDLRNHLSLPYFYNWLALCMSFGSIHSIIQDNIQWYMNGSTGLAEPVIYDVLPQELNGNPFDYFRYKSFLIRQVLDSTWNQGGREAFKRSMQIIRTHLDAIYDDAISQRKSQIAPYHAFDEYSETEGRLRLEKVKKNLDLIENFILAAKF